MGHQDRRLTEQYGQKLAETASDLLNGREVATPRDTGNPSHKELVSQLQTQAEELNFSGVVETYRQLVESIREQAQDQHSEADLKGVEGLADASGANEYAGNMMEALQPFTQCHRLVNGEQTTVSASVILE